MSSSSTSSSIPQGLATYGNTCYANTAFQCLKALNFKELSQFPLSEVTRADLQWNFTSTFKKELASFCNGTVQKPCISQHLLQLFAQKLKIAEWNGQQDSSEFLEAFFNGLERYCPKIYRQFSLKSSTCCSGEYDNWAVNLVVPPTESNFDLALALKTAVHRSAGSACSCGKELLHIVGELPSKLVVIVNRYDESYQVRADVSINVDEFQTVAGQQYRLTAMSNYEGATGKGGAGGSLFGKLKSSGKNLKSLFSASSSKGDGKPNPSRPAISVKPLAREAATERPREAIKPKAETPPAPIRRQVTFTSSPRTKSSKTFNGIAGHWSAYVRQGEDWYLASDTQVTKVSVIPTNGLFAFFYERVKVKSASPPVQLDAQTLCFMYGVYQSLKQQEGCN